MTSAETIFDEVSQSAATIEHALNEDVHLSTMSRPDLANETSKVVMAPIFRLRDLPEELQRHCISFCLPSEWHIRASGPMRIACDQGQNPYIYGLRRVPPIPPRLYLVDKHTYLQAQAVSLKCFTGELYLASVVDKAGFKTYSQYGLGQEVTSGRLDSFRKHITTVHTGCYKHVQDFDSFDENLLSVLPKLRTVVAHSEKSLHEKSLYGWGDATLLIRILSSDALIEFMQRTSEERDIDKSTEKVKLLWKADIRTILEMKMNMGSGEMMVSFYCIFLLQKDEDPIILGKYSVKEWLSSSKLRKSVYEKAI